MNKRLVILAVALVLALPGLYADIGENFQKAGIGVWGSGSFYYNFGNVLSSTSNWSHWYADIGPGIDIYAADNLSLYVSPYFHYDYRKRWNLDIERSMYYGVDVGLRYMLVANPKAQRGLVPSVGVGLGVYAEPGVGDTVGGVEGTDDSLWLGVGLNVPLRLYFFINDRIAFLVGLDPSAWYGILTKDSSGTTYTIDFSDNFELAARATVGFAWFVPTKKATIIGG